MKWNALLKSAGLCLMLFSTLGSLHLQAQSSAVTTTPSGSKVFLEINAQQLRNELDTLMSGLSSYGAGDWNAILTNGSNPGMDVDFSGYDAKGIEDLIATGTLNADSLTLNKDASISGRLTVSGVTTVNDSLKATAFVSFEDSLEVVRAVSIGETLFVTGVTSLGDSLHVVGKVDLDAMLNVDGAATFGSSLVVAGVTTLNDSLKVNGNAGVTGTLGLDSLSVTDVINGQVNSLDNFTSDALMEGDSNLYFSAAERTLLASLSGVLNTLDSLIAVIEGLGGASESAFTCGSPVSYHGYDYATVEIGSQCWFAENLRSTMYNDDAVIPSGLDNDAWSNTTDGAMTIYDEGGANEATNLETYGRLYNWHAVNTGKLCPSDWHVPTDEEWTTLSEILGANPGDQMKSSDSDTPAWNGTNSSGFSGLPGGRREEGNGNFNQVGNFGEWWSSSPNSSSAWVHQLTSYFDYVWRYGSGRRNGFSVRCVRAAAATASVPTVVTDSAFAELYGAVLYGTLESDGGDAVTATGFRWGAEADLSDAQDLAGSGTSGAFNAMRMGLTAGTTYYFTAFATNAEGTAYGDTLSFQTAAPSFTCGTSTVTFDGYDYETVEIGSQCWFAENLQSTKYNDDATIPTGLDNMDWVSTTEGAVAVYADSESEVSYAGRLYNWYAVNTGKLCPAGWHVPENAEWTALTDGLGGTTTAGGKMKSSATDSPSWNGNNSSGFSAVPGGLRSSGTGDYFGGGGNTNFWSASTGTTAGKAYIRSMQDAGDGIFTFERSYPSGFSVRCIQAATATASVPTVVTAAASDVAEEAATLNGSIDSDGGAEVTATGYRWGALADLSDAQDLAGSGMSEAFTGSLTGLTAGTTYYFTAFATNAEGTAYGDTMSFQTAAPSFTCGASTVTFDGYDYETVEIGSQCWFAENLRSTNYNDDAVIPSGLDNDTWNSTNDGAVTVCDEGGASAATNLATYGRLYNWHAVNTGKLCPTGWHVPSDEEWTTLTDGLDGADVAGGKMKSSATDDPSWDGSNESGFSGLPGGYRLGSNGSFSNEGDAGNWWSSSPNGSDSAWPRLLYSASDAVFRYASDRRLGLSVRCVRD